MRASLSWLFRSPTECSDDFSACHRVCRASSSFSLADMSARSFSSRSFEAGSFSFLSASSSIFIRSTARLSSSISTGEESISILSRLAASSMRSMALSGSWRPVMYRLLREAAATSALSAIATLWCAS